MVRVINFSIAVMIIVLLLGFMIIKESYYDLWFWVVSILYLSFALALFIKEKPKLNWAVLKSSGLLKFKNIVLPLFCLFLLLAFVIESGMISMLVLVPTMFFMRVLRAYYSD
ncbi:MAG TPA: hypothetical protein DCE41_11390 [Cytophagales bacterium]|nr:hypothetical protein [Cytophagales bacterium]HAA22561.1 hypothetical protein [Cytophagales bacterium]HAP63914.1 hypothetical protein [Cytophagales bacterium]